MPHPTRNEFITELRRRYGLLTRVGESRSLVSLGGDALRVYIRYSKVHPGGQTFYGLRSEDIALLQGHRAVICFLWADQADPLFVPFDQFESVIFGTVPARDGQYKVQIYQRAAGTELYIAQAGRFNVEGFFGWSVLEEHLADAELLHVPDLTHAQVQTLLGAIGAIKGYGIWVPPPDRAALDWNLVDVFEVAHGLPSGYEQSARVLSDIEVMWLEPGTSRLEALYEVEHTTSVYSGLLRFNDVLISSPQVRPRFTIVSSAGRRDLFTRQINRPTFCASGLTEVCTFLDYRNVYAWFQRAVGG